jgi:Ca2+-transporting ATPase
MKIIDGFKKRGEIIGMTGDGVNDALSLRAAHLGIAMGQGGTEVAKEAADIVLLDNNFKSIVAAIEEGRRIYGTIKNVVLYLISTGLGEFLTIFGSLLLGWKLPILPSQILWLNLVTDGFLVFALGLEPKEPFDPRDPNATRPRTTDHGFFSRTAILRMMLMSIVMAVGSIVLFAGLYKTDFTKASTLTLTALAIFQWFNAWNVRSEKKSIFAGGLFTNPYLVVATIAVIVLQFVAVYTPFMQKILHTSPLTFFELLLAVVVSLSIFVFEEVRKMITPYIAAKLPQLKKQLWHQTTHTSTPTKS